jgi:hypothetical protein
MLNGCLTLSFSITWLIDSERLIPTSTSQLIALCGFVWMKWTALSEKGRGLQGKLAHSAKCATSDGPTGLWPDHAGESPLSQDQPCHPLSLTDSCTSEQGGAGDSTSTWVAVQGMVKSLHDTLPLKESERLRWVQSCVGCMWDPLKGWIHKCHLSVPLTFLISRVLVHSKEASFCSISLDYLSIC